MLASTRQYYARETAAILTRTEPHGKRLAYLRSNKFAISVFDTYDEILEKCAQAWNFFANDPQRITSITKRDWIKVNY
jgi:hypothetical protein